MKKKLALLIASLFLLIGTAWAQAPVATPAEAITGLLNRIGGNGAADLFEVVIDANLAENGKDVFVITSQNGKPCIKGNTQLSVATGINWYLNHYAHINLTWNNLTTDLSKVTLPVPGSEEKHVCNTTYRYNFNTCTFSYSMAFWTWERWQKEIDWMALHGINAPLNLVGLDVVTRKFLRELGVSENDINAYIAGPGFIAWFAMNNLEGWGGTINADDVTMNGNPDWWYTRQEQLCRNMLQRMRELGMQPVIPGFSGQVPNCIVNYRINGFNSGDVVNNGTWAGGYTRPDILKPNTQSYRTFAEVYYKHLHEVMGVSELYSIDPFHEGSLPSGVSNETCYPNIMVELDKYYTGVSAEDKTKNNVDEQPKWIIQYWQGVPQSGAFSAMSSYGDRFIGLDLFADNIYADNAAKWRTDYYQGRPYVYCMLHNFGGRSGMHGRLETTMDGYFQALAKGNNCQGIGATPEGTETNPVLYDMLFELPWMDPAKHPSADEWLEQYNQARYGTANEKTLEALKLLKKSVWDCKVNQQGTSEAVILARPNWTVNSVSSWSTSAIYWDTQDILEAADLLVAAEKLITSADGIANYNYDVIDVIRQAMVDYAAELLPLINAAKNDDAEYTRLYQLYLRLMLDLDEMLSYDENFKLERWTSLARNIANEVSGTTENDRRWLEWNARTQITVWSKGDTDLHDYSNRCWAGLIKDFHYKRWEKFFTTKGGSFSDGWFSGFEYPWTVDFTNHDYSTVTIPNDKTATQKAVDTFGKYFGRVKGANKNYIFPMGITRKATKSDVIPEVYRGKTVELPLEIGKEVTITSVWVDFNNDGAKGNGETLTATNNQIAIPADAKIGKTTAQVVYSDGTDITFNLALVEDINDARTVTAVAGANGSVAIEGTNELSITNAEAVKMTATANTGYNFENWTDEGGNVVSNDNPYIYYGKEAATFTANFIQDKWGVVACNGTLSGDIASYAQFIHNLNFAYYNREAETIFATTTAPTEIFNTIPQIVNVPQGASFTVSYDNGNANGLKYCYFRAFIDLNQDGDFDDEGELLKEVGTNGAENTAVCSNEIKALLPYDMPLGITHMRLRFDGAWDNGNKPSGRGAKDASIRPVYELIINVTEGSNKAAHVIVESNNDAWGTAEVWTDETPGWTASNEWDVSASIPVQMKATKASEDVEFLGWYDHYGRLLTTELEYAMLAREDATYTAKFRKALEIDGWQFEYRTQPGSELNVKVALANGVKPEVGKTYYIYAPTNYNSVSATRYLYDNNGTLSTNTSATGNNYIWTCIVNNDNTYSFQNASGKFLAEDSNHYLSVGATPAKYYLEDPTTTGLALKNAADYSGGKYMVTKHDGSAFNRNGGKTNGEWCSDYVFTEVTYPEVVVLTNVRQSGDHDLDIPETVEILGEQCKIVGFDNNLFKNNKDLWTISLPSTIEEMSNNKVFEGVVKGKGANAANEAGNYITTDLGTTCAAGEDWSISLTIEDNGNNFNQYGSALIATGNAPMNSTYGNGFQLYLQAGGGLVVKTDADSDANKLTNLTKGSKFRIDIVYTHANTQLVVTATPLTSVAALAAARSTYSTRVANSLTLTQDMSDFSVISHAIPEGVNITKLEVRKGTEPDPFEGCTNLLGIEVADGCESYYVSEGTLYTAGGTDLHELADADKEVGIRSLGELIGNTQALMDEIAVSVDPVGKATEIALSTTQGENSYITCNAPTANEGVGNLLDGQDGTILHTEWDAGSVSAYQHYLLINLAEDIELSNFSFRYKARTGNSNTMNMGDIPSGIKVYGSNEENGEYKELYTISGLSQTSGYDWTSPAIDAKPSYRYLRFNVTANSGYWHMAEFDLFNVSSVVEVALAYKTLGGITNEEATAAYDLMVQAQALCNIGGTTAELEATLTALQTAYDALNAKQGKVLNGVYNINFNGAPTFVAYSPSMHENWGLTGATEGYRMFDATTDNTEDRYKTIQDNAIAEKVVADELFKIVPNSAGTGYTISAQGLYMQTTSATSQWCVQSFSTDEANAGVYEIEQVSEGVFKLKSFNPNLPQNWSNTEYVNDWGPVFGNDMYNKPNLSTFSFTPVTEYTLTVPASGVTTLCLPFNVVLPEGVDAYDINNVEKQVLVSGEGLLQQLAVAGDIVQAGTPMIIKAAQGDHTFAITMESEGAKTSLDGSVLSGNYVKQTLAFNAEHSKYVLNGKVWEKIDKSTELGANNCWIEVATNAIDYDYNIDMEPKFVEIDGWKFRYEPATNGIMLTDAAQSGNGDLVIPSSFKIEGKDIDVVAISPDFLHGNKKLTSIEFPATMVNLGFRKVEPMFGDDTTVYEGEEGDGATYNESTLVGEAKGLNREYEFPKNPLTGIPFVVESSFAWRLTLDVTIDDPNFNYNNYGSAIVSTNENSLADSYTNGDMQIYMKANHSDIIVKIDNADDRYSYTLPELVDGKETGNKVVHKHFIFELEHDGSGGYQVVIYYDDGRAKMYNISASEGAKVKDFDRFYYSLPKGIRVKVKVEKLYSEGLFVGCTNLTKIEVDEDNPTFMGCDHGVLYDKNQYYVMRIPEGETGHHFEIPSKVVRLYPGAVHGVTADVVLHSNPQIGVVTGHEDDVKNVNFYLSLDDIDNTITENETGYGGARDFISANNNHYLQARYKRTPLAKGVYGTLCLPFDIKKDNAIMKKYDFYEFTSANETSLIFTQVTELEYNKPYLYKLKDSVEEGFNIDRTTGCDVFQSAGEVDIKTLAKFDKSLLEDDITALGAFVNNFVETNKYSDKAFYYYKTSAQAFYQVTKKLTYRPYRAFFVVNNVQAAQAAPRLSLQLLDGTVTDIDASLVEGMEAPEYYDLSGRRVLNPISSGIYVVNGKKVFIK